MRIHTLKATLNATLLLAAVLLFGAAPTFGQQPVSLTAAPTATTLPDGTTVQMWGYFCTALPTGVTSTATCAALNPASLANPTTGAPATWSPVVITVPAGQDLQINLTNSLSFASGTTVPTSLVIVGQLGAGLGTTATSTPGPDHTYAQGCVTWPIADAAPGQPCDATTASNTVPPPAQGNRVQSFSTEVAAGVTTSLCWGVCGGTATTRVLRPGTYLLEAGTHPSIQGPMGLYGMVVVTCAPGAAATTACPTAGTAYPAVGTAPAVTYSGDVDLLFSEIDPVQNNAVSAAVNTVGFSETMVWSGQPGGCGNPSSLTYHQCYPPAVNYTPLYYLINGLGFNKTNAVASQFSAVPATGVTGNVLVRLVNAGLRMHVPSIVGSQTATTTGATTSNVAGFSLIAEDGNPLPGVSHVQSEVFMAAGKTYDVMINAPATVGTSLPIYDRELSLSANATGRDGGMLAYISINGSGLPSAPAFTAATARPDTYNSVVPCAATAATCTSLTVSDPGKGVIANDTNVYGVQLVPPTGATNGTLLLNADGTFTYTPNPGFASGATDTFTYCANSAISSTGTCPSGAPSTTIKLGACGSTSTCSLGAVTAYARSYRANTASSIAIKSPGVLGTQYDLSGNPADTDSGNYPLKVVTSPAPAFSGGTLYVDSAGGFTASIPTPCTTPAGCVYTFNYQAQNSQGTTSAAPGAQVTVTFPAASNLQVTVLDGADKATAINDYRWIIEEDRTFYVNPNCAINTLTPPAGCPSQTSTAGSVPVFGVNFHTSSMPVVAAGCTGSLSCEGGQQFVTSTGHQFAVCDVGNGVCRLDATGSGFTPTFPSSAVLDPAKRYYISILPGDAAVPFQNAYAGAPDCSVGGVGAGSCGHGMGGAPIAAACTPAAGATTCTGTFAPVTILTQPSPYPPAKLSVFVFEDDFPLNGEQDGGGGTGAVNTNYEPGLGGFEITLFDDAGGTGDATGQLTHDMFNQPLVNSLAGTPDPLTGVDACPITTTTDPLVGMDSSAGNAPGSLGTIGITARIVTCPEFEADGVTPSPLAGQAVVPNMMQGRYGVVATPAADRIARGEEWLQTNTLDGQKAHDSFLRIGEPSYFQEFGPAGWHVAIGFANPAIINSRLPGVCAGTDPFFPPAPVNCNNKVTGFVSTTRMSRTPDERLYGSGSSDSFSFTQCYVSFGDPDGEDFAFTKCNADGSFSLSGLPDGNWRLTVFDQWNDMLVDGLSTPVGLGGGATTNLGELPTNQWQANIYTSTFFDTNGDGVRDNNEAGLTLVPTNIRFRDGSYSNFNNTDLNGNAGFNEVFPLFSWYVIETDTTRYKTTGTHVVYDAGGPADGTLTTCGGTVNGAGYPRCGTSNIGQFMANTAEQVSVPTYLRVPGARYCASADCPAGDTTGGSTGRVDPPMVHPYGSTYGWQGFSGQNSFLEFGKKPYALGENGGIHGEVNYASTRPFDDPQLVLHVSWTPDVANVTVNLYQEGFAADGVTPTLKLVDTTKTSSWDDWAQGFRKDAAGATYLTGGTGTAAGYIPNVSCPGQSTTDLFFYSLNNQPDYLDAYNNVHSGTPLHPIANNSQFKCYDGMHNWNQLQPAVYDGMYQFPSVTAMDPTTGKPTLTNCTICIANPDTTDPYRSGTPMLPAGKYVVEVVVPPGYELVKEEDKNILIGDNYIAPVTQQFGALGSIYIIPDQAAVGATYNANNAQNPTTDLGSSPRREGDTGSVEEFWPCVGEMRVVPDFMSIFPYAQEVAAFAGATRPLCDRKEITLQEQMSALAKFYIFSSTHVAAHFTGVITDDYTSEFDPFSPVFGEKFSPPDLPVSIRDWAGNEISRVYADHWGDYDGLTYSSWEVNPPNPTGYGPTMMVTCMNDPGPVLDTRAGSPTLNQMITDPLFTQGYSQFCYEIPFMPGQTQYMDTPVVPTSAFAGAGYNNVDCSYPDATPAVSEVDGSGLGPWVSAAGATLTIRALGDQYVPNNAYIGPSATVAPYNQKSTKRHFGFGTRCTAPTATSATCNTASSVSIGGVPATIGSWSDTLITVTVPVTGTNNANMVQPCPVQQQTQYGGSTAYCGELDIISGNGKHSVDTVNVTIGGKAPKHVAPSASIQAAIDAAAPGDMLMIDPAFTPAPGAPAATNCATATAPTTSCVETAANHNEILIMWKPVRLQGVGAATSIINANTHPAGEKKVTAWRQQINCLFGIGLNGSPINTNPAGNPNDVNRIKNLYDPTGTVKCPGTGWAFFNGYDESDSTSAHAFNPQVDRLPLEATVGWDANLNGNLAELLQEPSLMGALEGAAITVLSKGVKFPADPFDATLLAGFPTGTTLLIGTDTSGGGNFAVGDANPLCHTSATATANPYPSNFMCNPSSIDGLGITDSSQGGGGIFVHGWGHNLQIANNRIYDNAGTLSGGINLGQGEFPGPYVQGGATNAPPGSCEDSPVFNTTLPLCQDINVNIHHNYISLNSSTGDELFSATPAGAGGVTVCTGSDYYKFNYNWVCGNLTNGDGGGFTHMGFSYNGDIEHNTVLFNQSLNPTIPANGGGLMIMGTPDADLLCNQPAGAAFDQDCAPFGAPGGNPGNTPASGVTPSDGVGPGLVINANLIMGNGAEAGTGGGIAFTRVNGNDIVTFPTEPALWNAVLVTNNIIVDNVSGWDGSGISLADSPNVNIINNTIAYNNSTASAGILFNTIGAPLATQGGTSCVNSAITTCPQPAGLVAIQHSPVLLANLPPTANVICPAGHFQGTTSLNGSCKTVSYPQLENNIFWRNGSFYIGVTTTPNPAYQQNLITLFNMGGGAITTQPTTGACVAGTQYWDIGVRGDTGPGPTQHGSVQLTASDSVLTPGGSSVLGTGNVTTGNPNFAAFYCDGSRTPPEAATAPGMLAATAVGWQVPPGISDATVPNPIFNLTPSATVDEGNNWVNLRWGPLSMTNPTVLGTDGNYGGGANLGNYAITTGSSAIGRAPANTTNNADAPAYDFYDRPRRPGAVDAGAVQLTGGRGAIAEITLSPALVDFGAVPFHSPIGLDQDVQVVNSNNIPVSFNSNSFAIGGANAASFRIAASGGGTTGANSCITGNGTSTLAPGEACIVNVVFVPSGTTQGVRNATLTVSPIAGLPSQTVSLTGRDTIATVSVALSTPFLATTPASAVAHTGTITVTNTQVACFDPAVPGVPAGCNVNAGPYTPTAITLSAGTPSPTAYVLGGTCAVGTPINPGTNCTITITYTPPGGVATAGSVHLTVTGYGTASTAPIINTTYPAN